MAGKLRRLKDMYELGTGFVGREFPKELEAAPSKMDMLAYRAGNLPKWKRRLIMGGVAGAGAGGGAYMVANRKKDTAKVLNYANFEAVKKGESISKGIGEAAGMVAGEVGAAAKKAPGLLSRATGYLKAHPKVATGVGLGAAGLAAYGGYKLMGGGKKEDQEGAEDYEGSKSRKRMTKKSMTRNDIYKAAYEKEMRKAIPLSGPGGQLEYVPGPLPAHGGSKLNRAKAAAQNAYYKAKSGGAVRAGRYIRRHAAVAGGVGAAALAGAGYAAYRHHKNKTNKAMSANDIYKAAYDKEMRKIS
jgi:hypothetical protein